MSVQLLTRRTATENDLFVLIGLNGLQTLTERGGTAGFELSGLAE